MRGKRKGQKSLCVAVTEVTSELGFCNEVTVTHPHGSVGKIASMQNNKASFLIREL